MAVVVTRGDAPLILAMPHVGTALPDGVAAALDDNGRLLADTDWHVDRLYDGLAAGATIVRATFHRYVVDANRDPSGASLYPGRNTTGLVPVSDFDGRPIWREGMEPDAAAIAARRDAFHRPYHAALSAEIDRLRARHRTVVLFDCHSIRSRIPFLFEGTLPDFNLGTNDGRSCAPALEAALAARIEAAAGYSAVVNGRFKGGWTTRQYGRPADGIHAVQMELAQATHLAAEAPPFAYDAARARQLRPHLAGLLADCLRFAGAAA